MRVAMDAVRETGTLCEARICYTGDLFDPRAAQVRPQVLRRRWRRSWRQAGAHILGIKDMAGLCQPRAARALVKALKEEIGLPVHFHTHDTSGIAAASVLAAIDAGCDAVDGALDAMSGLTSQPNLGSIVAALRHGTERDSGLDPDDLRALSNYWERRAPRLRARSRATCAPAPPRSTARDARRPVHQPARAGPRARASRHALARGGAGLRRGQPDVRRHRQGHAVLEGGRRHGADDGHQRPHRRGRRRPGDASRLPGVGGLAVPRRPRPAARRLPARTAAEDPRQRAALDLTPGRAPAAGRSRAGARAGRRRRCRARSPTTSSRPG